MGLTDRWVALPADDELRRSFAEPGLDERGWEPITVPGHWRCSPAFADSDGPLLHRTHFEQRPGGADRRWWLRFDGLFYQGDVWLDGAYLGDTEGYFSPHVFEITEPVRARTEHTLAVELTCAPQTDRADKRNITGVFQHWDCFDPAWNPGGIWRPVSVVDTGPVRIDRLTTRCLEASDDRAVLAFVAHLDSAHAVDAHVRTTVGAVDHGLDHTLAAGDNTVEWSVTVERPRLWWPHALGDAHLETVGVEVRLRDAAGSAVSDRRRFRTGLRSVRMRRWIMEVNGERLFLKGTNQGPTRMALGEATPEECRRDIALAKDTGLDLVRLHAHVARPETYEAADESGMLLWQDFPLQWGYSRQIKWQAVKQASEMVALLGHHPSVAVWCGHNEPIRLDLDVDALADPDRMRQLGMRTLAAQQLPSWNRSILDRAVKRAIERTDGTRAVVPHSGVPPHLPRLRGTDSHLYFGWYFGDERDLPAFARAVPSQVRFPTEFGAQAVPDSDGFVGADRWPDLDWERLATTHSLQRSILDRFVPREGHTYESWKRATQEYQATLVRRHVETLRRLKYRPTGGFAQFCFADGHPAITWSVLDHERRPKLARAALAAACRPVIVVADRLPASVRAGDALALDVHVVSDRRTDVAGRIDAMLEWDGGGHRWAFEGAVPADSCVRVGTVQFEVPDAPGRLTLRLSGTVGEDDVENTYATVVAPSVLG
jgi:beta-mannosidase